MKTLNASQPSSGGSPASRFESAIAESGNECAQGSEMICRPGDESCVPLDEWTSKLS